MARDFIPQTVQELTPAWLTQVLRAGGTLREASVIDVSSEILGEGEGFVGQIARLRLTLDRSEPGAPETLIAKIPTPVEQNRAGGEMLGAYEREIHFYRSLAPEVAIPTPRLFHAEMDPNPAANYAVGIIRFLERLPWWLLRLLVAFFQWIARFSKRRYLLLLEDLAPARVGDQVAGCSLEEAERVLRALARAQAKLWRSPKLDGHYWIADLDVAPRMFHIAFRRSRAAFDARFRDHQPDHVFTLADWLDTHAVELFRRLGQAPPTIIHGDYRLDNLFFDGSRVIAADWQGVARGPGVFDIAYFLSGCVHAEASPPEIEVLLRAYHDELVEGGVRDYPYDACRRDYERALLLHLHRLVMVDQLEMGEARGKDLVEVWLSRLAARLQGVRPEELLGD